MANDELIELLNLVVALPPEMLDLDPAELSEELTATWQGMAPEERGETLKVLDALRAGFLRKGSALKANALLNLKQQLQRIE